MTKITGIQPKVDLNIKEGVANANKVEASDINEIVSVVNGNDTLLTNEIANRESADTTLQNNINAEAITRASEDVRILNEANDYTFIIAGEVADLEDSKVDKTTQATTGTPMTGSSLYFDGDKTITQIKSELTAETIAENGEKFVNAGQLWLEEQARIDADALKADKEIPTGVDVVNWQTKLKNIVYQDGYIVTNVGIGNVVDLTPVAPGFYNHGIIDAVENDIFYLKALGGSTPRLWAFLNSDNEVISVSGINLDTSEIPQVIKAPPLTSKVVFNINLPSNPTGFICKYSEIERLLNEKDTTLQSNIDTISSNLGAEQTNRENADTTLQENIDLKADKETPIGIDVINWQTKLKNIVYKSGYITTNVGVGNVVNLTSVASAFYNYGIVDAKEGDKFYLKTLAANTQRAWTFINASNEVISVSDINLDTSVDYATITAPAFTSKAVFNNIISTNPNGFVSKYSEVENLLNSKQIIFENNYKEIISSYRKKDIGKNKFDKTSTPFLEGYFINNNSEFQANAAYNVYLIPIEEKTYFKNINTASSYDMFLNENFIQVGSVTNTKTKTYILTAKYLLLSVQVSTLETYQIELNTTNSTTYESFTENKSLKDLKKEVYPINATKVTATVVDGQYQATSGVVASANYSTQTFTPKAGKVYYISTNGDTTDPVDMNYLTVKDGSLVILSDLKNKTFKNYIFEDRADSVTVSYLTSLPPVILEVGKKSLESYFFKGALTADTFTEYGEINYVKKNITLTGYIGFSVPFVSFTMGKGNGAYFNAEIIVTPTQLTVNTLAGGTTSVNHGLTITDYLFVRIDVSDYLSTIRITSNSGTYDSASYIFYGDNKSYIKSGMDCEVYLASTVFKDANKLVRAYGDSYLTNRDPQRWTFQACYKLGADFYINNLTGESSLAMYKQLVNDFRFGVPKIILWCLGMNDDSDVDINTPNPNWLKSFNAIAQFCEITGVEFVPVTIPTVPIKYHEAKAKYVRDSGYRYVDFANIVDNGINDDWYDGMLASDDIHPTTKGAMVLAIEALSKVPELYN